MARIDDTMILKRAKQLCKEAGIAWDWFDAAHGGRVLDVASRRECLMRARQQLINEIRDVILEPVEPEPETVVSAIMAAAGCPVISTQRLSPSHRIRDNAA